MKGILFALALIAATALKAGAAEPPPEFCAAIGQITKGIGDLRGKGATEEQAFGSLSGIWAARDANNPQAAPPPKPLREMITTMLVYIYANRLNAQQAYELGVQQCFIAFESYKVDSTPSGNGSALEIPKLK